MKNAMDATRWLVLLALAACSADPEPGVERSGVDRSALASYSALWAGYFEAYELPSGSDRVLLELDAAGDGRLTIGQGTPPSPPIDEDNAFDFATPSSYDYGPLREGFEFSIRGARVEDERIRFEVDAREIYEAACAVQTPVELTTRFDPDSTATHSCLPEQGFDYGTEAGCFVGGESDTPGAVYGGTPVSCSKQTLCRDLCDCTEQGCSARRSPVRVDAALDLLGERLDGSLQPALASVRTVRLRRAAAAEVQRLEDGR